jgi:Tfp pilus assembly protein PilF
MERLINKGKSMKCSKCSQENPEGAKFCLECGTELSKTSKGTISGKGPALVCSACGNNFFAGDNYIQGAKNYCWECLCKKIDIISDYDFKELGDTQRKLVNNIRQMGGVSIHGEKYWTTFMKVKAGELPGDVLKESLYSKDPDDFASEFQRLLHGIKEGYFASLESACELSSSFNNPSDQKGIAALIEALQLDDPYLISSVSKALGKIGYKKAVPALIAAFDEGGFLAFQRRTQIVEGRSKFGSYRDKIQGLCEALLMIGDPKGLDVAESQLKQLFADAKMIGVRASMAAEQKLLDGVIKARGDQKTPQKMEKESIPEQPGNDIVRPGRDIMANSSVSEKASDTPKASATVIGQMAGNAYSKVLDKTKALKDTIDSGSYKKILDNKVVQGTSVWFRASDARLKVPVYILWSFIVWIVIETSMSHKGIVAAAFGSVPQSVIMGLYVYAICNSGRLHWIVEKLGKIPWSGLLLNPLVVLPSWVFGWPAEKAYGLFFYKFTCIARGLDYIQAGEYRKAVFELENARVGKNDTEGQKILHSALGDAYEGIGDYDKAAIAYDTAIQYDSEDLSLKMDLAYCLAMKTDFDGALKLFREVLQVSPDSTNAYLGIGRCYINMEMYADALTYLNQALSLEPQNATTHKMLAEAYSGLGNEGAALKEAQLSLTLKPESNIAKEAQEIIDYIQYGSDMAEPEEVPEPERFHYKETAFAEAKTTKSTYIDINKINDYERQKVPQPVFQASVVSEEDKNLLCSNLTCKKEIPGDSVFCGYCGTKVVQS